MGRQMHINTREENQHQKDKHQIQQTEEQIPKKIELTEQMQ